MANAVENMPEHSQFVARIARQINNTSPGER